MHVCMYVCMYVSVRGSWALAAYLKNKQWEHRKKDPTGTYGPVKDFKPVVSHFTGQKAVLTANASTVSLIKQKYSELYLPTYLPINQSINQSTNQSINQSVYQSIDRSTVNRSVHQPINQSINRSLYIYISIYQPSLPVCLSMHTQTHICIL